MYMVRVLAMQFAQFGVLIQFIDGDNVYGIMRGRRASGTESILLSTDISDSASVAILLALAADYQRNYSVSLCAVGS